MDKFEIF